MWLANQHILYSKPTLCMYRYHKQLKCVWMHTLQKLITTCSGIYPNFMLSFRFHMKQKACFFFQSCELVLQDWNGKKWAIEKHRKIASSSLKILCLSISAPMHTHACTQFSIHAGRVSTAEETMHDLYVYTTPESCTYACTYLGPGSS